MADGTALAELTCTHCHSTFLEEIGTHQQALDSSSLVNSRDVMLSEEQSRRLASATIILRLLEAQLRDELATMSSNFNNANANTSGRQDGSKPLPMSQVCLCKLRKVEGLDVDTLCSQPCCPVCSEDFVLAGGALQLPCSHLFHENCVMPWLDAKRTCPICRYELTEAVPTVDFLERFTETELQDKITEVRTVGAGSGGLAGVSSSSKSISGGGGGSGGDKSAWAGRAGLSRGELATMLHESLMEHKKKADTAAAAAEAEANLNMTNLSMLRLLSPRGLSMSYHPTSLTMGSPFSSPGMGIGIGPGSGSGPHRTQSDLRVERGMGPGLEPRLRGPSSPGFSSSGRALSMSMSSSRSPLTGGMASSLVYSGGGIGGMGAGMGLGVRGVMDESDDSGDEFERQADRERQTHTEYMSMRREMELDRLVVERAEREMEESVVRAGGGSMGGMGGGMGDIRGATGGGQMGPTGHRYMVVSSSNTGVSSFGGASTIRRMDTAPLALFSPSSSGTPVGEISLLPARQPQMPQYQYVRGGIEGGGPGPGAGPGINIGPGGSSGSGNGSGSGRIGGGGGGVGPSALSGGPAQGLGSMARSQSLTELD